MKERCPHQVLHAAVLLARVTRETPSRKWEPQAAKGKVQKGERLLPRKLEGGGRQKRDESPGETEEGSPGTREDSAHW